MIAQVVSWQGYPSAVGKSLWRRTMFAMVSLFMRSSIKPMPLVAPPPCIESGEKMTNGRFKAECPTRLSRSSLG